MVNVHVPTIHECKREYYHNVLCTCKFYAPGSGYIHTTLTTIADISAKITLCTIITYYKGKGRNVAI